MKRASFTVVRFVTRFAILISILVASESLAQAQDKRFCVCGGDSDGRPWSFRVTGMEPQFDIVALGITLPEGTPPAGFSEFLVRYIDERLPPPARAQLDPDNPDCYRITGVTGLRLFVSSPDHPDVPDREVTLGHPQPFNPIMVESQGESDPPVITARTLTAPDSDPVVIGIEITVQDIGSGLAAIFVLRAENVKPVMIPPFNVGTTEPVVFTAIKDDLNQPSRVEVLAIDVAGNCAVGDPVITVLEIPALEGSDESMWVRQKFTEIPQAERYVTVRNGDPGLKRLRIKVNGKWYGTLRLKENEQRTVDVSSLMVKGGNTMTLKGYGKPGASALVIISDGTIGQDHHLQVSPQLFWRDWQKRTRINFVWGNQVER